MKTDKELLEEWEREKGIDDEEYVYDRSDYLKLMARARAEERKKLLLNNKDNKLNNQIIVNNKPKITREQVESLKKIVKLVEQINHNHNWYIMRGGLLPYDWTDYMGRNLFELAKEIKNIKAMGLEVED